MNFFIFLLSFSVNPIITYYIPSVDASKFLSIYAASNIIFSLMFTVLFIYFTKQVKVYLAIILIISVFCVFYRWEFLVFFYPFAMLAGDYLLTQSKNEKGILFFRAFLIISALSFLFLNSHYYELLYVRVILCMSVAALVLIFVSDFKSLKIDSGLKWISYTYIFYSGTLLLIPLLSADGDSAKIWFIACQIGLGVTLKKLDFSSRGVFDDKKYKFVFSCVDIVCLIIPIVVSFFYLEYIIFVLYYISFCFLKSLKVK
jgi:hypothetical protein